MTIQVEHQAAEQRFVVEQTGQEAELVYRLQPGMMVMIHTGVPEAIEHRGIASVLAKAALEFARSQHLKVDPQCPFVAAYLRSHTEYNDLIDPE